MLSVCRSPYPLIEQKKQRTSAAFFIPDILFKCLTYFGLRNLQGFSLDLADPFRVTAITLPISSRVIGRPSSSPNRMRITSFPCRSGTNPYNASTPRAYPYAQRSPPGLLCAHPRQNPQGPIPRHYFLPRQFFKSSDTKCTFSFWTCSIFSIGYPVFLGDLFDEFIAGESFRLKIRSAVIIL